MINISMDDRHQFRGRREMGGWSGTLGLVGHLDIALTAAPECVEWYEKEDCPALYFPEASDPEGDDRHALNVAAFRLPRLLR